MKHTVTQPPKALFAAVIIMGLMIIIGTSILLTLIFQRMTHGTQPSQTMSFVQKTLPMPKDARIKQLTHLDPHHLALLISKGDDEKILIWDPFDNQIHGIFEKQPF